VGPYIKHVRRSSDFLKHLGFDQLRKGHLVSIAADEVTSRPTVRKFRAITILAQWGIKKAFQKKKNNQRHLSNLNSV
jgi:hypothetical protein